MQLFSSIATATRTQIWSHHKKVKGHSSIIISTNLVDFESLMLSTKIQPQSFYNSGEDFLGMAAILFTGTEPFEQTVNILSTEGPMWNLVKLL